MAKNIFFEEVCDGVLCEAEESFGEDVNLANKEKQAKTVERSQFVDLFAFLLLLVYCTVINHFGHSRTLEKCRQHSPAAHCVFYVSFVFSNARTRLIIGFFICSVNSF